MTIYAIEVQAHTGAGGVQTFYAADARLNTGPGDTPANQHFHPSLKTPANFERHLFSEGTTSGASSVASGEVVLANAHGRYDAWADYAFDGRPIIIRAVPQDHQNEPIGLYKDAPIMIRGTIESLDITDAFRTVRLRIHDRLADLDAKPLLTTRYLGTTTSAGATAEGPATLKDTIKPRAYGKIPNVTPIDVNPFNLIRQVSDRACTSIVVYDGGQPLSLQGDYPTIAAIATATLTAGQYATSLALGLIRLGGTPAFIVTADVVAAGPRDAASFVKQILTDFGITSADIDTASIAALTALNGASCGLWVNDERTALNAISAILMSVGGWIVSNSQGVFTVGRLDLPAGTPAAAFTEWQERGDVNRIAPGDANGSIPAYRVTVRYGQLATVFSEDQIAGAVSASTSPAMGARRAALQQEWQEAKAEDMSVQAVHLLAPELTFDTCLTEATDAAAEAARLLAIYKVRRDIWNFRVSVTGPSYRTLQGSADVFAPTLRMGSVISLQMGRFLTTPKLLTIIGRVDDAVADAIEFSAWG
ncbi:hypothetical protein [Methylobacterium longum]|uniref:Phage tail protein n=1 Tax=Methylobacterium longum TaxID=767694 RepID=A0ABT8APL6_9HYPH|nr:hypothetical protein [Methylobacterium longum]MDN3571802.1 hypothetical protein [Methylobacterium longum]GJE14003.1 hypothetical protein FOHLNKBM_5072 [Methylobacterium longum]